MQIGRPTCRHGIKGPGLRQDSLHGGVVAPGQCGQGITPRWCGWCRLGMGRDREHRMQICWLSAGAGVETRVGVLYGADGGIVPVGQSIQGIAGGDGMGVPPGQDLACLIVSITSL